MRHAAGIERALAGGAVAAMLMLASPAWAQIGTLKTFRDWTAGCDNARSCTALSLPEETADDIAYLRLERPAGPEGAPTLMLKLRAQKLKPRFEAELALDGAAFPARGRRWPVQSLDGETAEITLAPAEAEALIAAARKATALTIRADGHGFKVSLAGSVAAMLWLDEQQGRLGTPGALIRKGTAASVPPAPPLPVVALKPAAGKPLTKPQAAALTRAMRAQLNRKEPDSCEEMPEGFTDTEGAWALDDTTRLVVLACSRGAYNVSSEFWLVPGNDVARAKPAAFDQGEAKPTNTLVNADFDPKSGRVMFLAKGRGIGDCGASGSYGWTGSGFAPLHFSAMGECRLIGGDDWITLYRSEERAGN